MASILSVNVGSPRPGYTKGSASGIVKEPVAAIEVCDPGPKGGPVTSGVVGDAVLDRRHHGGTTQAVYAVAREELTWWGDQLGRELPDGMFGENLTTLDLDVEGAVLGELWQIGDDVVLEVCGPRVPCSTFAARMGEPKWVRRFTERGRTGAYLAVRTPGRIASGDAVRVLERPSHGFTVPDLFRAWSGDRELAAALLASGALHSVVRADLAARQP